MIYTVQIYGSNTLAAETSGLVDVATITAYSDISADITAGTQPLELNCYFIRPDFEPAGESFTGVGDLLVTPIIQRDIFDIQSAPIDLFTEFEGILTNLKTILSYKWQYLVIPDYEFDINDHYGDGSSPKCFCVAIEKTIETDVGIKTISLLCKRRRV